MAASKLSAVDAARELVARDDAKQTIVQYIKYLQLGFEPVQHHRLLLSALEAVERGEIGRLMVMMPPGSGKSSYTSATFPAWYLGRNPSNAVICCSHTDELAEDFGRRCRNLFERAEHKNVFECGVSKDKSGAGAWETDRGGVFYAAGVGGTITGRRADLAIIDDPVKSRADADSETRRRAVWSWYENDFVPRLKPEGRRILVQTRWHQDDLAGRLLEREANEWKVLELPMEAMPGDPLGRAVGERLWPEWFTEDQVLEAKKDVRSWNALYQQQPASEEGDYFKLEWFGSYDKVPKELARYGASDYAVTDGSGDFTEHGVFGVDAWGNVYVLDWWRGQAASDEWIERQCDLVQQHGPLCWFGESGVIKRSVMPYLQRRMEERRAFVRMEWLASVRDKATRCRSFQALCAMGKVYLPNAATSWKAELLGQLTRFPAGKYDDGVDVCSLIGRGLEIVSVPRMRREPPPEPPHRMPDLSMGNPTSWMSV